MITWSCLSDRAAITRFLIDQSLDPNRVDADENTPIFTAISGHGFECLAALLAAPVNMTHLNKKGATILHWTACWDDVQTVNILSGSRVRDLDTQAIDEKGRSLMQVLESHPNRPAGFDEAFAWLLANVERARADEGGISDVFFDCAESP